MKKILSFSLLLIGAYAYPLTPGQEGQLKRAFKAEGMAGAQRRANAMGVNANDFLAGLGGESNAPAPQRRPRPADMPADRRMNATELATKIIGEAFDQLLKVNPQAAKDLSVRMYIAAHPETASSDNNDAKSNALGHLGKQKKAKRKR